MAVLRLSYDGRAFSGSQRQSGRRTVQGELERAIQVLAGVPVATMFAGRTDAGVHAAGQIVNFEDPRPDLSADQLVKALNAGLPDDIGVQAAWRAPAAFHARHDATWRAYRYRLWIGERQPLVCGLVAQRMRPVDIERLASVSRLVGTHDFASLAGNGDGVPWSSRRHESRGTVRTIYSAEVGSREPWWGPGPFFGTLVEFAICADGFLPRMVRNIVGALIEIGEGRREPDWLDALLASRDRRLGPKTAPPEGLTLWSVGYEEMTAARP